MLHITPNQPSGVSLLLYFTHPLKKTPLQCWAFGAHKIWLGAVLEAGEKHGRKVSYYACDVRQEQTVKDAFTKFVPLLQHPIRGLLACAGISLNGPSTEFPVESIRRQFDINATGTFVVAQLVANEVKKTGLSASMVFVASMSGYVANKVSSPVDKGGLWR